MNLAKLQSHKSRFVRYTPEFNNFKDYQEFKKTSENSKEYKLFKWIQKNSEASVPGFSSGRTLGIKWLLQSKVNI